MDTSLTLGIESSCDETAVAVVKDGVSVLSNQVASQADLHRRFGGVVPEVASRRHYESFPLLVGEALKQAGAGYGDLTGVAVTAAPGLIGSLLVGLSFAKGLAFRLSLPFAAVHHVEAHLYACRLDGDPVEFPALGLVVSGGHTEIHRMLDWGRYETLCATRDDAAGEAFDKAAKLLGLGYPGGPALERLAADVREDPGLFPLTRMKDRSLDFSFSGLKTALALELRRRPDLSGEGKALLAARFQRTVVEEILSRVRTLLERERPRSLVAGGGVVCNQALRSALKEACDACGAVLRIPPPVYCADNAAMVAGLGSRSLERGEKASWGTNASADPSSPAPFLIR
jgi:N6-L-threonylcarbamoyladenine synthase